MSDEATWRDVAGTPDDPNALRGRRVLVMGLGLLGGGVAAARYAAKMGAAEIVVTDLRSAETLAESVAKLDGLPIRYVLGRHEMDDFTRAEVVVRNPGVRRGSPYLEAARAAGARVEMEIAWFFRACPGKIIGITGTRGKGTTTMLLHDILVAAGKKTTLGGNMGIGTLDLLPAITPDSYVVLEIGVWMCEGLHLIRRSPHLAIFMNVLPDHLDAFDSMEDYAAAKTSIFRYQGAQDNALFNLDNDYTKRFAQEAPGGHVWLFSPSQRIAFDRDHPNLRRPFAYEDAIRLAGPHHLANVQAATLAAEILGVSKRVIRQCVASCEALPHRLETIRTLDSVTYINDSASTAPVAGVAALRSFTSPIVLIAGGNSKRLDCGEVVAAAAFRAKSVILLKGTASEEFATLIRDAAKKLGHPDPVIGPFDDLRLALKQARKVAEPGDVTLFSPGFTSFGMFHNEYDRGDQFRAQVRRLRPRRASSRPL